MREFAQNGGELLKVVLNDGRAGRRNSDFVYAVLALEVLGLLRNAGEGDFDGGYLSGVETKLGEMALDCVDCVVGKRKQGYYAGDELRDFEAGHGGRWGDAVGVGAVVLFRFLYAAKRRRSAHLKRDDEIKVGALLPSVVEKGG